MLARIKILFLPDEDNNYKSKVLHLSSLSFFIFLIIFSQVFITFFHRLKPGVLGFASSIDADTVLSLTNKARSEDGFGSLVIDPKLNQAARQKAADMFAKDYWAHYAPDGTSPWWFFKSVGYTYTFAGENLARDFNDSSSVIDAWMISPTHRDNILNPKYENIGIAVVDGVLNGEETTLVVQMFGAPSQQAAAIPVQAASEGIGMSEALAASEELVYTPEVFISEGKSLITAPVISSFLMTKILNVSLLLLFIIVLLLDGILIFKNKIIRISGRSFIHFSFLVIILTIIILTRSGQIL